MIQKETLMNLAYEQLKSEILEGKLQQGSMYSTQYFADYLNISKTPCREALQRLEKEGLVELNQAHGVVIKGVTMQKLLNITQFRSAIDSYCAYYMAENIEKPEAQEVLNRLKDLCDRQQRLLEEVDDANTNASREWYDLDNNFHTMMCEFTGNPRIIGQRRNIDGYIKHIGIITANIESRKQQSVDENRELLEVIEKKKPFEAYRASRMHAEKIYRLMLQVKTLKK